MKTNLCSKSILSSVESIKAFLLFFFLLIAANAWGQYSYTFTSSQFTANNQTKTLGTANWTLVNDGGYYGYDATKGQQIGSASNSADTMTLTTSSITGTITTVKVSTSGAASVVATVGVKVGSTTFSPTSTSISATNTEYTFTGSASGAIVITWNNNSAKALYIKKLDVNYSAAVNYTVTFNGNGNTSGTMAAQSASSSTSLTNNAFAKTGYNFGGWASSVANATAGTVAYANQAQYAFSSNATIYAIWSFGITYNNNGGAGTIANQNGYYNGSTSAGTVTLSNGSGFTRSGYIFGGWKTTSTGTTANYTAGGSYAHSGASSAVTLYAHWLPVTYTLTYNGNDNTSDIDTVPANQTYSAGDNITLANTTTLLKSGYTLDSWHSSANGNNATIIYALGSTRSNMPASNQVLYARWRFGVTYDSNGGSGTVVGQNAYYNGAAGVQSGTLTLSSGVGLTKSGYTFGGWKTTAAGTIADYGAGDIYTHTGTNTTRILYAHWILNESTLTVTPDILSGFNYIESHGPSATQTFTVDGIHLDGSTVNLLPGDNYEISLDNGTTWLGYADAPVSVTYTGTTLSKAVLVRLKAGLTTGTYSNPSNHIVAVEGGGDGSGPIVTLQGTVSACLAPTTQSFASSFTSVISSGMTVNLTAGNGIGRIVKINTTDSFTDPVSSNALPIADAVYAGSEEQVVYADAGNNVAVTGLLPSTTYYYRVYEYNICSGNYIYNKTTVTNNPRAVTTLCQIPANPNGEVTPLENPACSKAILIYELSDPKEAGVTYYWQTTAGGTSTANPVVFSNNPEVSEPYSVTVSGNYYVRAYNGFCWSAGSYVTQTPISISTSANITTQPTNQNAVAGANANFTVTASGTAPFTYQWQESATGAAGTWVNIGTSSNTLTLTNVPLSKNGYKYHVIVSNDCGSKISNVATLSVISGPCFEETFNAITTGNNTSTSGSSSAWSGNTNFPTTSTVYQAGGAVRIGTTASGTITSRSLNEVSGNITVELDLKGWTTVEGSFNVTINGVTKNVTYTNEMADGFETKAVAFENVPAGSKLTISTTRRGFLDAVRVYCAPSCTPATITAFPTSGPANTVVTITGANFTATSTVKFGTANATVEYINATQLKAVVPATANGDIVVDTALDCDSEAVFNLIKEDASGCEAVTGSGSGTFATHPIIYEVYDENGGSGGTVSIYNGTNAAVNLSDYSFYRANDYGVAYGSYGTLSGILPVNGLAVIGVSGSQCGIVPTGNGSISGGFNANDGLQLRKGSVVIDDFKAPNYVGYYLKRKNGFLFPKSVFVESEWTSEDVGFGECLPNVLSEPPAVRIPPVITAQPSYTVNCDVVNASLVLTATEGYAGGDALAYQWYELKSSGTWTAVSDGGVYSGATTQTLTISDVNGLNNYQYYCQVKENTVTCYTATNAAQIKEASNTWASNVWTNGTPVLGSKVIIAGSYNTQTNGVLDVCDLTVNTSGSIRVKPNFPVTVKKKITNNASAANFIVESDANLIQTDNTINEGDIRVERQVTDMNNISSQMDYVYWGSPVSGQAIKGASGFSPNTPANGYLQYNETNDKFTVTNDTTFLTGKGYAIRAETGTNGYSKTYAFSGVPNNGDLQFQNLKWTDVNHGFNLVGNPYPSNIDFDLLYSINSSKIYSTAFFWTNNMYEPQQMGSGYAGNNYAIYNITGGVPATYDDGNPNYSVAPNGKIKVGQAFIVQSKSAGTLDFNNNIRVTDNGTFYQRGLAKNRFWLTMKSPNNLINTILVGYIPGATNGYETDFDSELLAIGSDSFYSSLDARKLAIQGKGVEFSIDDVIALGSVFSANGTYTIKLQKAEGSFDGNQTIYLRDKVLNKYINLSVLGSYTFDATKGTDNTRFEIVYKDKTLNANENKKSEFLVYKDGQDFVIRSSNKLGRIEVFDISGRLMKSFTTNQTTVKVNMSDFSNGIFIIKAENSGDIRTKKINK